METASPTSRAKLTRHDADLIRDLAEWKREQIARINSIASQQAIAEKFGVSKRCIERVLAFEIHRQ